jgi:hypothetical protein
MTGLSMVIGLALLASVIGGAVAKAADDAHPALVHTHEEFSFVVQAPYDDVFPLFGAHEERKWAAGFDPQFVYPSPAHDRQGMVFITEQEGLTRVWTNTAFDGRTGHVQYVYFVTNIMAALIDIHLKAAGVADTTVHVVYERTALRPEANEEVAQTAERDARSGPRWAQAIDGYFAKARTAAASTR